jgi:hypothetical protein
MIQTWTFLNVCQAKAGQICDKFVTLKFLQVLSGVSVEPQTHCLAPREAYGQWCLQMIHSDEREWHPISYYALIIL